MKQIEVTVISSVISDRGQKKLEEHSNAIEESLTEEQCENLGIPYKASQNDITLEDEDFELLERQFFVAIDKIITYGYSEFREFTEMFLTDDVLLSVKEKPSTIKNRINKQLNN